MKDLKTSSKIIISNEINSIPYMQDYISFKETHGEDYLSIYY